MLTPPELPPHAPRPHGAPLALGGVRVVDFSHFVAGPLCTMILGDYGADVIKIENPARGDDFRHARYSGNDLHGAPFFWTNRNKRSVTLDLSMPEARAIAAEMIAGADIVVENFSTGVMEKFGLGYATVSKTNPGLVYCSISAAGRTGPMALRAGFDPIAQAESGFMSINGHPGQPPVVAGSPIMDMTSAMMASNTILAAYAARLRLGKGQHVEIALFDQGVMMLGFHAMMYLMTGEAPEQPGNTRVFMPAVSPYETKDRPLYLCCSNTRTYQRLVLDVLKRPDLMGEDYATDPARAKNAVKLRAELTAEFAKDTRDSWLARLRAAQVPAGAITSVDEALTGEDMRERGLLTKIEHPTLGAVPNIAPPFRMSLTPPADPRAAPLLGQHTREVLTEALGYDEARLDALANAGAFGPP
ncbi:MAG: CaiB/BaiF CoA transferase family protein, partial [Hyphomonadaceae bacterium]